MANNEGNSSQLSSTPRGVNPNKTLKLDNKSKHSLNEEVRIISLECKDFKALNDLLGIIDFVNYPNVIIIRAIVKNMIKVKNIVGNEIESIKNLVKAKLEKSRPILLQVNLNKFLMSKGSDSLKDITNEVTKLNDDEIKKSFKNSKFTTQMFLKIQPQILKVDFNKFSNFEKVDHRLFLCAIKAKDEFCIRLLNLFDFSDDTRKEIFHHVVQSKNFDNILAFFEVFDDSKITSDAVQKMFAFKNFLLEAVECQNFEAVEFFLKKELSIEIINEALELSLDNFEMLQKFKQLHLISEEDMEKKEEFLLKFHENIKNGSFEKVKKFCENYPKYKLCKTSSNVCALEVAIDSCTDCKKFDIYTFLRAKGFYSDKESELDKKIDDLTDAQKEELQLETSKYFKHFPDAFIESLIIKCKFEPQSPILRAEVRGMLNELNQDEISRVNLTPFLKIAAQAKLKITFDFSNENVKRMVPGSGEGIMGLTLFDRGELFIGRDESRAARYGCFMHEISHMVFNLIYENKCLPYCKDDVDREKEWVQFFESIKLKFDANQIEEEIIELIFKVDYEEGDVHKKLNEQLAELAVRPNHIMAQYLRNPGKVNQLRDEFKDIFNFIQDKVLPDIEIPNLIRLIKLNNDFEVIKKIQNENLKLEPSNALEILNDITNNFVLLSNVPKLALSKLFNDITASYKNKLHLKAKNIFVDVEKIQHEKAIREELVVLMITSELDRVIFDATETKDIHKIGEFLRELPTGPQIIVVCGESNSVSLTFTLSHKAFSFEDLTHESKLKMLETQVEFQNQSISISKVCDPIFDEIFSFLCNGEKVSINKVSTQDQIENFIPRTIQTPSKREVNIDKFLESVKDERVVLISDVAGSGKTTLLWEIHRKLLRENLRYERKSSHWISFVSLIDHVDELLINDTEGEEDEWKFKGKMQIDEERNSKILDVTDHKKTEKKLKSFEEKLVKILKLNKAEEKFFIQKFSKGEAKILFDGFDEISPKCKKQTLKLFKKFQKQNQNQIFITTRTHLEQDVKENLKVESFEIKILTEEDQIKFLINFWKKEKPDLDESFIKECALKLTKKIYKMIENHQNLIGIPLIIQSVAKLYKNEINEQFDDVIKNLKFSVVLWKLIEQSLTILDQRFKSRKDENVFKRWCIFQALEYLTIVNYFDEEVAASLGLSVYVFDSDWGLEETARSGILTYDANKKVKLNHETYGQRFLSSFMENILNSFLSLSDPQIEILQRILTEERFEIARMFLSEKLEDVKKKNQKVFYCHKDSNIKSENFFEKLSEILRKETLEKILLYKNKKSETILHLIVKFGNFETFKKVLETIREKLTKETQKELIQVKDEDEGRNVLMISTYKNENSLKLFLEFVFELMEKNEIQNFLNEKDKKCNNFLHLAAEFAKSEEIFEFLWMKVFETFKDEKEKLKNYLKVKGFERTNLLMMSILNSNLDSIKFLWKVLQENLSRDEIFELLNEKDEVGNNFLHRAAVLAKSKEILEFLLMKVFEIFKGEKEKLKSYLKVKGFEGKILLMVSIISSNLDSIKFLWKVLQENLSLDEIFELLNEKDESGDNLLYLTAFNPKSKEIFEFYWLKIFETFKGEKEKLKNYLKAKGNWVKKFLVEWIFNSEFDSIKILWKFVEENLSQNEIFELLNEKDEKGINLLHLAVAFAKSKEIFEFLWMKFFETFKDEKEELKNYLKVKGLAGSNLLMMSIPNSNLNSHKFLWKVLKKVFNRDEIFEILNEKNEDGNNFLHVAAALAKSKEIFEFLWMKVFEIFKGVKEELKNYLKVKGLKGRNLLMQSTLNSNLDSIKFLFKVLEENLDRDEIFEFLNEKDDNGNNFLHLAAAFAKSKEIFEFLWMKVSEIFKGEKEENIFKLFLNFKDFIYECDNNGGQNFLHLLARSGSVSTIEFAFKKLEEKLSEDELKSFLMTRTNHKHNLLHYAVFSNQTKDSCQFWVSKVKKFVSNEEFKEMLKQTDADGDFPLHICIQESSSDIFEFYTKIYEKIFTKDEIKEILRSQDFMVFAEENKKTPSMRLKVEDFLNKLCDDKNNKSYL